MNILRPWRRDDRPSWWTRVQHEVTAPLGDVDRDAATKQARAAGWARSVRVTENRDAGTVSVYLLIRADTVEEATHAAPA